MRTDRVFRDVAALAERLYGALTNRDAVQRWLPPHGAQAFIEKFEPRVGGAIRLTLLFDTPGETGTRKSTRDSDIVNGEFRELVPNALVRQAFTFESDDVSFAGVMIMTWTLTPSGAGTRVVVTAEDIPSGIDPKDHEHGMASSLANLARYAEQSL